MSAYTITAHLDISVELTDGRRFAELVVATEEYVRRLNDYLESNKQNWWSMFETKSGGRLETAKLTKPLDMTGLIVRDAHGTTLLRSGSGLDDDRNRG